MCWPSARVHCVIPHVSVSASPSLRICTYARLDRRTLQFTICRSSSFYTSQHLLHHRQAYRVACSTQQQRKTGRSPLEPKPPLSGSLFPPPHSCFSTSSTLAMPSDDAYMSFLDKANADLSAGRASQQGGSGTVRTETVDANARIPAPLQSIDAYYVSDTDEPFEPVVLKWDGASRGAWPSAAQFSSLISPDADLSDAISTLSPSAFDPRDQYAPALHAVRAAAVERADDADQSAVDVKVYRVEIGSTRVEYWVLALHAPESRLVGLRAKAVES